DRAGEGTPGPAGAGVPHLSWSAQRPQENVACGYEMSVGADRQVRGVAVGRVAGDAGEGGELAGVLRVMPVPDREAVPGDDVDPVVIVRVEHRVHDAAAAVPQWLPGQPAGADVPYGDVSVGSTRSDELVVAAEHGELARAT